MLPCLSKGLLTRDPATDLTLLNLTLSLDERQTMVQRELIHWSLKCLHVLCIWELCTWQAEILMRGLHENWLCSFIKWKGNWKSIGEWICACTWNFVVQQRKSMCRSENLFTTAYREWHHNRKQQSQIKGNSEEGMGEQQILGQKPNTTADKDKLSTAKTVYTVGKEIIDAIVCDWAVTLQLTRYPSVTEKSLRRRQHFLHLNVTRNTGQLRELDRLKVNWKRVKLNRFCRGLCRCHRHLLKIFFSFAPTQNSISYPQVGVQRRPTNHSQ